MKLSLLFLTLMFPIITFSQPAFIENKGQWDDKVMYKMDIPGGALFTEKNCLTYAFYDKIQVRRSHAHHHADEKEHNEKFKENINCHSYKVHFLSANTQSITPSNATSDYLNYFIGKNRSRWASKVKKYKSIRYEDVYPRVDLLLYTSNEHWLKYDFEIYPGGSAENIKLKYEGHTKIESTPEGNIKVYTSLSEVTEIKPIAWQEINGIKVFVACKYLVKDPYVAYSFPNGYNPNYKLVIDPALVFCTYSGSTTDNWGFTATFDDASNVFSGGIVFGMGYPTNVGVYQMNQAGAWDVALIKYDQQGSNRIFATYLGGLNCEMPHSMVADNHGNLIIFGTTGSADFPISLNAYDTTFNGGTNVTYDFVLQYPNGSDIFVSKISADGSQMLASTFIGGSQNDGLNYKANYANSTTHGNDSLYYNYADGARGEVICGKVDEVYIGTTTFSNDFPVTLSAFQPYANGNQDGIVFKFSPDLSSLLFSSYFGGSNNDAIYSLDIDAFDEVYIAGGTTSVNIMTTGGVYQPLSQGGSADGFVAHITNDGSSIIKSTYFGSSAYDQIYFVRVDKDRNVYVTGQTKAPGNTFIYNALYNTPNSGQFIAKLPNNLSYPLWSTVFGTGIGKPNISISAFAVDYCNRIYLAGWGREWAQYDSYTWTSIQGTKNMDVTPNAFQSVTDGQDFYLMVLADDASQLEYATFLGEVQNGVGYCGHDHVDGGTSRFDKRGNIYQSVCASCGVGCNAFPTNPNPGVWSPNNGGTGSGQWVCNNAVIKFNFEMPLTVADFTYQNVCVGEPVDFTNTSQYANTYHWYFGDGNASTLTNPSHTYTTPGQYIVSLVANDPNSCNLQDSTYKLINVVELNVTTNDTSVCINQNLLLSATSTASQTQFIWSTNPIFSDTLNSNTSTPDLWITANQTQTYYLHASTQFCEIIDSVIVETIPIGITTSTDTMICLGSQIQIHAYNQIPSQTLTYQWGNSPYIVNGQNTSSPLVNPSQNSTFYVTATNTNGCSTINSIQVEVDLFAVQSVQSTNVVCFGQCNGNAIVNTVGINPITYLWSNNANTPSIQNLCPNTYTVTVTDSLGCSSVRNITITQPPQLSISSQILQLATCSSTNPNTGIGVVTPSGGTPGYSYLWNNLFEDSLQTQMYAGDYSITITDANGCDTVVNMTITDESPMQVAILPTQPLCYGDCNGSAFASIIAPGTPSYSYLWNNSAQTNQITNICSGYYSVTVTDSDNCVRVHSIQVQQPTPVNTNIESPGIPCYGESTSLNIETTTGGTPNYQYQWFNGTTGNSVSNIYPGTYWVITTDSHNCKDSSSISIAQPNPLVIDSNIINTLCAGLCNGQIQVLPAGGTFPYTYNWDGVSGNNTQTNLCSGNYNVTVSDANHCSSSIQVTVSNQGYSPPLNATADTYVIYPGQSTQLHALTNSTINQYIWSPGESLSGTAMQHPTASPEETTTYIVTVVDNYGCRNIDTVTISILEIICGEPYIYVPNAFSPNNDGKNDIMYAYAPMITNFYFAIYDRWGEMVFASENASMGWDGTYKGKPLDPAVFVYYLKVRCLNNETFEKQGNITLVR